MWRQTSIACSRIAAVLDRDAGDYLATLDGNEQYDSVEGIAELWQRMGETPALARLVKATLFIEQPIKRAKALATSVEPLARLKPLIIDESDGELASFPAALRLGYSGVSSKNCKGLYKSILNAARVAHLNAEAGDGTVFHVRRGPDHARRGERAAGPRLGVAAGSHACGAQRAPLHRRHVVRARDTSRRLSPRRIPTSTTGAGGPARLRIDNGRLQLGSLGCPGFAVAADMDFASLPPMPVAAGGPDRACQPREGLMSAKHLPERFESVAALEDFMTEPPPALVARSCGRAGGHPDPRRGRQDGTDAGALGQARCAGQTRGRASRASPIPQPAPPSMRRASRRSPATFSTGAPLPGCRSSTTSSSWLP